MLVGTADPSVLAARAPIMESFPTEALELEQVEVLQVVCEIDAAAREAVLPPGLHPTNPPLVTALLYRCPTSPFGPFAMAQLRVECRSGVRSRAFLVGGVIDNVAAAGALATRFGYTLEPGTVVLRRQYDAVTARVTTADGRLALAVTARDPDPLAPADVQYVANMNLAHTPRGLRLVQVEPGYRIHRAERGRPHVEAFDGTAWGDARIRPTCPVSASVTVADVTLPPVRFVCRPDVLAFEGTESVR
jgi:hypothetical protein